MGVMGEPVRVSGVELKVAPTQWEGSAKVVGLHQSDREV